MSELPEPQSSDPETERYLLFNAVAGLLGEVAETVPLCVVLDDLHWADAQSLALLKHLLRSTEQGALQVIVTYRDSDLGKDHPLTAVLADLRSLAGRAAHRSARPRRRRGGRDHDARSRATSSKRTGSSWPRRSRPRPTATRSSWGRSCLGSLSPVRSCSMRPAARWSIDSSAGIALPESVREVIERRVERLGEESLEALRLAAVIGREFDLELLVGRRRDGRGPPAGSPRGGGGRLGAGRILRAGRALSLRARADQPDAV